MEIRNRQRGKKGGDVKKKEGKKNAEENIHNKVSRISFPCSVFSASRICSIFSSRSEQMKGESERRKKKENEKRRKMISEVRRKLKKRFITMQDEGEKERKINKKGTAEYQMQRRMEDLERVGTKGGKVIS